MPLFEHLRKQDAPSFAQDVRMRPNARAKLINILTDTNACQIGKPNTNLKAFVRAIKNKFDSIHSIRIPYNSLFALLHHKKYAFGLFTRSWVRLISCLLMIEKYVLNR